MINELRYFITKNTDPYENLALEEYLLLHTQPGECVLYLWQNRNTVVVGRNQNVFNECRVQELEQAGGFLARRLSGGGAVFHDLGNLNFTFFMRHADYDIPRQLSVIEDAVRSFGLDAQKTGRNDVTVDGRKFSGNAFYRAGDHCYHHGTLLIDVDTEKMSRFLQVSKAKLASKGVSSVRSRVVNLAELDDRITVQSLTDALLRSFGKVYGAVPTPIPVEEPDWDAVSRRAAEFSARSWLFGANASFHETAEARWSWGGLELNYTVQNGVISQLRLFSDGMDGEFLQSLPEQLIGCRYDPKFLSALAETIPTGSELQRQMVADCIELLKAQIE